MKMKNKITYATAYRDWLAALQRIYWGRLKLTAYGYTPAAYHGCQLANRASQNQPNNNYGP